MRPSKIWLTKYNMSCFLLFAKLSRYDVQATVDAGFPAVTVDDDEMDPVVDPPPLLFPTMEPPAITTAAAARLGCELSTDFVTVESSASFYEKVVFAMLRGSYLMVGRAIYTFYYVLGVDAIDVI